MVKPNNQTKTTLGRGFELRGSCKRLKGWAWTRCDFLQVLITPQAGGHSYSPEQGSMKEEVNSQVASWLRLESIPPRAISPLSSPLSSPSVSIWKRKLVRKSGLFLIIGSDTSSARNENLRPLLNTNIPPISGKYGLRNHFWSLESRFLRALSQNPLIGGFRSLGIQFHFFKNKCC